MPTLLVQKAMWDDVYRDIARVPEAFRLDRHDRPIPESTLCEVITKSGSAFLFLRGKQKSDDRDIWLDERSRNTLGVHEGELSTFEFVPCDTCGEFRWAWQASEPAYRISVRLAITSLILGFFGLGLGIFAIFK